MSHAIRTANWLARSALAASAGPQPARRWQRPELRSAISPRTTRCAAAAVIRSAETRTTASRRSSRWLDGSAAPRPSPDRQHQPGCRGSSPGRQLLAVDHAMRAIWSRITTSIGSNHATPRNSGDAPDLSARCSQPLPRQDPKPCASATSNTFPRWVPSLSRSAEHVSAIAIEGRALPLYPILRI